MAQQTAVDWLIKELELEGYDHTIEIAKQMEKEQIIKAYSSGSNDRLHNFINEQYYNETYKK